MTSALCSLHVSHGRYDDLCCAKRQFTLTPLEGDALTSLQQWRNVPPGPSHHQRNGTTSSVCLVPSALLCGAGAGAVETVPTRRAERALLSPNGYGCGAHDQDPGLRPSPESSSALLVKDPG